ncbi:MAG: hypothetical protein JSW54_13200 [Fidelibacterota bacterium]|nr:MAG: hypothetical protein JSW54_13200 [Candidatus Neomarinimicrobiota bacterium]
MRNLAALSIGFLTLLAAETKIIQHDLGLTLDPTTSQLTAVDVFQASYQGKLEFQLGTDFTITNLQVDGKTRKVKAKSQVSGEDGVQLTLYRISLPFKKKGQVEVRVEYAGRRAEDTGQASFSREKIAMSISATISEEGVFLAPSGGFYPRADEQLSLFKTKIHLPPGWDAVSEGDRTVVSKTDQASQLAYQTAHPVDGIFVSAATWDVNRKRVGGVDFYTFFFPEDTSLARQYLDMSIRYVNMYSRMISPYPFSKFAVVENFFPTGYGMPSYTVLGRSVVRLPFIVHTSLGHEVLHNWWGNSVYIGEGGNWCEGLTTYQADYLYKLNSSEAEARQYRKDILKDYTVYVEQGNDFPPSQFTSRSDMSTRAVGYGKVAMIFHMLEDHIGREAFMAALQDVVSRHQWTETGYADLFQAFERASGKKLDDFMAAWVQAPDAPLLELIPTNDAFVIRQTGTVKPLWIPVRLTYSSGEQVSQVVYSNQEAVEVKPESLDDLQELAVDPDYHLMRRLADSELDATLRDILNEKEFVFVVPKKTPEWKAIARSYRKAFAEDTSVVLLTPGEPLDSSAVIYLGTIPANAGPRIFNLTFQVGGRIFDAGEFTYVWAFKQENGFPGLIIYCLFPEGIKPLPAKLPHYGKYGYLVFTRGLNKLKGNHEAPASPLIWERGQ